MRGKRVRLLHGLQLGVGLGQRYAGLEPRNRLVVEVAHICGQITIAWRQRLKEQSVACEILKGDLGGQRNLRKSRTRWQHTDDRGRLATNSKRLPNHSGVA